MTKKKKRPSKKTSRRGIAPPRQSLPPSSGGILDDLPELQTARALWARQRIPAALTLFGRAVRKHPRHVLALADAARAFGAVYHHRRAEHFLTRLCELGATDPAVLHLAAQSYRLIRRPELALECFRAASSLPQACHLDTYLELALLLERQHELIPALEQLDARQKRIANDAEGNVVRARIMRRLQDPKIAETLLQDVVRQPSVHWLTRMRAFHELATLFDQQQRYDEAWQSVIRAKRLALPHAAAAQKHRNEVVVPLQAIGNRLTREHVLRWRELASLKEDAQDAAASAPRGRSVLLTGIPRSGTTLLMKMLAELPGVAAYDECDAFARWIFPLMIGLRPVGELTIEQLDALPQSHLERKRRMYSRFLESALGIRHRGQIFLDKNPSLLPLLPFYHRMMPREPILVMIRDPRDLLVSNFMTFFPLNDFSVDFLNPQQGCQRILTELECWQRQKPAYGPMCTEIHYEQLLADPTSVLDRVRLAIGAPPPEDGAPIPILPSPWVYSPTYEQVIQPIHRVSSGRWRHYEPYLSQEFELIQATTTRLHATHGFE